MEEKDYCLVEIDSDQVDACVKHLMAHLMQRKPWGGNPKPVSVRKVPAEQRVMAFVEIEAMIHCAIVGIAYDAMVEQKGFDGLYTAAMIINTLFIQPGTITNRGSEMILEGVVHMARAIE